MAVGQAASLCGHALWPCCLKVQSLGRIMAGVSCMYRVAVLMVLMVLCELRS